LQKEQNKIHMRINVLSKKLYALKNKKGAKGGNKLISDKDKEIIKLKA